MLHDEINSRQLGLLRIVVFSILFLGILLTPLAVYGELPQEINEPWGLYFYIYHLMPEGVIPFLYSPVILSGIKYTLLAACFLCIVGALYYRFIGYVTVFLIILFDGIVRGYFDFVNHGQIAIIFSSIILALTPAADGFTFFRKSKTNYDYSFPVKLISMVFCLSYSLVGIRRFLEAAPRFWETYLGDSIIVYLVQNTYNYSFYDFDYTLQLIEIPYLMVVFKIGFFIITVCEILAPLILVNRYLRYFWLMVMIPFHFLSLITMNIFFWENLILIGILFVVFDKKFFKL